MRRAYPIEYRAALEVVDSWLQFIEKSILVTEFTEFLGLENGFISCGIFE